MFIWLASTQYRYEHHQAGSPGEFQPKNHTRFIAPTYAMNLHVGQLVTVHGDDGVVRYIGEADFSPGQWVGIELQQPKGKNDGSVQGRRYFDCRGPKYGIFVRSSIVKTTHDVSMKGKYPMERAVSPMGPPSLNSIGSIILAPKKQRADSRSSNRSSRSSTVLSPVRPDFQRSDSVSTRSISSSIQNGPSQPIPLDDNLPILNKQIEQLKSKLKLMEKKRLEDKEKIQHFQTEAQKTTRYENVNQRLQLKLKSALDEIKNLRSQSDNLLARNQELMSSRDDEALEMATLDKEMAEERVETLTSELSQIRTRAENLELECDLLREELKFLNDSDGAPGDSTTILTLEKRNEKLENALVRMREISVAQEAKYKDDIAELQKSLEDYESVQESLSVTSTKLSDAEALISDLRVQLDNALGAEDMIENLSDKNMELNERIDELRNTIEELETLKELHDELEDDQKIREQQLSAEISALEKSNVQWRRQLEDISSRNEYLESAILKYRDLVQALDSDLEALKQQYSADPHKTSSNQREAHAELRTETSRSKDKIVDLEIKKFESRQTIEELNIIKCYLTEDYVEDKNGISAYLLLGKSLFQVDLLFSYFIDKINESPAVINQVLFLLADLECDLLKLRNFLMHCSAEEFRDHSVLKGDVSLLVESLETSIELLRKEDINEATLQTNLEHFTGIFKSLAGNVYSNQVDYGQNVLSNIRRTTNQLLASQLPKVLETNGPQISSFLRKTKLIIDNQAFKRVSSDQNDKANCYGTSNITFLQKLKSFLRGLVKCSIQLEKQLIKNDGSSGDEELLTFFKDYLFNSVDNMGEVTTEINELVEELSSRLEKLDRTELLNLSKSPWEIKGESLTKMKTVQSGLASTVAVLKKELEKLAIENITKDKQIEEMAVNLEVINTRLSKSRSQVESIQKLQENLQKSHIREKELVEQVEALKSSTKEQQIALDRFKSSDVFGLFSKDIDAALPLVTLQNENQSLKAALKYLSRSREKETPELVDYQVRGFARVDSTILFKASPVFADLRKALSDVQVLSFKPPSKSWSAKSHKLKCAYLGQVEILQQIDSKLNRILGK